MDTVMNETTEPTASTGGMETPAAPVASMEETSATPSFVDRRRNIKLLYGELEPSTDKATVNRLSNVRWPLGEEPYPDVVGTSKDDPYVNIKMEVVENPDPDPNQRHLLHGGPELRLKCTTCSEPLHLAAERNAMDVLVDAGFSFDRVRDTSKIRSRTVAAAVCRNGHITQLRAEFARRLIKRS